MQANKNTHAIGVNPKVTEHPVELVPISELVIHPFLENIYKQGNLDSLEQSMKDEGQLHEIFYDVKCRVVSGARRIAVAKMLGWSHIKARRIDIDDEATLHQLIIAFNQLRKKSFKEEIAEAKYILGIIGIQQGKKRKLLLDESDPRFDTIKSDRYAIAAKYCGLEVSGNTLRKGICVDDFEIKYPDSELNLMDSIERGIMSVDRAYKLAKQYPGLKDESESNNTQKADVKNLLKPTNWKIFHQSCIKMMQLANGSVATIATSIPYYQLRDYRTPEEIEAAKQRSDESELGQESTVFKFMENLKSYLLEMKRVLNEKGSLFINVGDTYSNEANYLVSHRLVIMACDEIGFHLVNEIVFQQSARLPQATAKRLQPTYEKVLHFVKSPEFDYYPFKVNDTKKKITAYKIDRPNKKGNMDKGDFCLSKPYKKFKDFITSQEQEDILQHCNVQSESAALKKLFSDVKHPAPYSTTLMLLPILTTTKPGDLVCDPFGGSGTTIVTSVLMGRRAVMFERQERFVKLAMKRISLAANEFSENDAEFIESVTTGNTNIDIRNFADETSQDNELVLRGDAA